MPPCGQAHRHVSKHYLPSYFIHRQKNYSKYRKGLAAMLTAIQSAGVTPEVNLRNSVQARKCASEKSTLALKPGADVTRSPKRESVAPRKGLLSSKIFLKKVTQKRVNNKYTRAWGIVKRCCLTFCGIQIHGRMAGGFCLVLGSSLSH